MAKKKSKKEKAASGKGGNIRSSPGTAPAAPWSAGDMAEAEPLPLPIVENGEAEIGNSETGGAAASRLHAGAGWTRSGGRPELAADEEDRG